MTNFRNENVLLIILGIVLLISFYKSYNNNISEKELKGKGYFTVGEIIDHRVSGLSETYTVEYEYEIRDDIYTKSVNYDFKFINCYSTRECIGKKFKVYYDPENPEENYIDFNDEL